MFDISILGEIDRMKERTSQVHQEIDEFEHKTNEVISHILPQIEHYLKVEAKIRRMELFAKNIPKKDKERAVEAVREYKKESWEKYLKKHKTKERAEKQFIKDFNINLV
ncbi:hypothetical protein J4414_01410 [Candidatus Woesearchaeota archaeon]|nr:hypothetical protein [Candidatus Woesearchaeota archaeon]